MSRVDVLGVVRHGVAGSASRYRYYQYVPALEQLGIRCSTATLFDDAYLRRLYAGRRQPPTDVLGAYVRLARAVRSARDVDVVFIEKEMFPFLPHLVEKVLRPRRVPYVVDLDDAVFHRYEQGAKKWVLGKKFERLLQGAAAVTAGSAYLAEHGRAMGAPRVEHVPTVVDLERYPRHVPATRPGPLTVGWIGAPVTSKYLKLVEEPLARFCQKTGSRLRTIGAGDVPLAGVPVERVEWSLEGEVDAMAAFDVGIMPLEDTKWERGKCALKLIQSMAMGQPVIASPVGANVDVVTAGVHGLLADGPDAWFDALAALHDDPELRARMGRAGRARVESDYSLAAAAPRLARILKEVADG